MQPNAQTVFAGMHGQAASTAAMQLKHMTHLPGVSLHDHAGCFNRCHAIVS
jgi:hypothetical protein